MSDLEQNARESALIDVLTRLDYPVRFITNTIVADTSAEAQKIADVSAGTPEGNLKTYRTLYSGALQQMRLERSILTQETYLVIPGADEDEAQDRLNLLTSSLRERTSVVVTPLQTTDEVFDAIQNILLPEKIIKPSYVAMEGVTAPLHFSAKELDSFVQKT
ncbi:MAG: hypothetical protein PHT79_10635 [Syntrophomonadaceae bacterium]|nr:hypothetical protein [Syntrophomonadaceae bacterium]MDD4550199.1 hypothetical protein [Syntrophomonadaceae bacterium]